MRPFPPHLAAAALAFTLAGPAGAQETQGVGPKAIPTGTPTPVVAEDVKRAIRECKATMACGPDLAGFRKAKPDEYRWLDTWCKARQGARSRSAREKQVCAAAAAAGTEVSIFQLAELADEVEPASCSGFGLTVPLFAVRYVDGGSTVAAPIEAGLGAGYYSAWTCSTRFSVGHEVFGWSQGLDPSGNFQIGVAAGVQVVAFKYFQFGLALGYDLYRKGADISTNGLLSGRNLGKPSLTTLVTFTISGTDAQPGR
jgi:hypothetical protein